ncbi:Transcriptional regulators-like protein [Pirellula staleyi DSM 6068]|uniref:Transcriptional regulators-like protein n=1 Tax=Pirellula staleyi (strain ATCC 27377 / DSM 6068 / ICPB 4128) TaxID=530564 RepID=D2R7Y9_PIRSD|nr:substrate-binding domain-containing protein [Pirellula staleyi]ADB19320.1 Transcriptional regulators-like protein [Pirellula staleyi DSM 6068]
MTTDTRPMYVQIAEQLLVRSRRATASDPAPSVRKVASQFGVSSVTASRALQLFRNELGGQSEMTGSDGSRSNAVAERMAVCLHVSPGPHQHAAAELTAEGFRKLAREQSVTFDFDSLRMAPEASAEKIRAGVLAAKEQGAKGIFLLPSRVSDEAMRLDETLIATCDELGLPVVLIERNLRGEDRPLEHDLVSFHDFEGGRLLTRHLLELGRKRIAFLTGSPTSSHVERLAGYLSALHSAGISDSLVIGQSTAKTVGATYTDFTDQLIAWKADSVICFHEHAAIGVVMELLRRGKSVPTDTAVAAFYSLGLGESFSIGITAYTYPAKTVAARALDVMRWRRKSVGAPPMKVVVPGELIARSSTVSEPLIG